MGGKGKKKHCPIAEKCSYSRWKKINFPEGEKKNADGRQEKRVVLKKS